MRATSLAHLSEPGFTSHHGCRRPDTELGLRADSAHDGKSPRDYWHCRPFLTPDDRSTLQLTRTEAASRHAATSGWRQENMWTLAWVLGFEVDLTIDAPLISDEVVGPLLEFLPKPADSIDAFLERIQPRSLDEVAAREDLFYCAHNAVRSAQTGQPNTVPDGFDAARHGGAVHERRHGLTWVLSPGVRWRATDLST